MEDYFDLRRRRMRAAEPEGSRSRRSRTQPPAKRGLVLRATVIRAPTDTAGYPSMHRQMRRRALASMWPPQLSWIIAIIASLGNPGNSRVTLQSFRQFRAPRRREAKIG